MKQVKILLYIILPLPSIFFLFLGTGKRELIGKIVSIAHLKEKNTFLLLGVFYLLFFLLFLYRNRKKKEIDFYHVFFFTLFLYSIASIPKLLNLTYFGEHFVYLAESLSRFRLDILPPPYYMDDPVIFNGKIYVAFPPFPALLMIPLSLIFGIKFHDFIFHIILGSLNVALFYRLSEKYLEFIKVSAPKFYKILIAVIFGFGTVHLSILHFEGVWYVAHTVSVTFLLLAIIESLNRRYFLTGLFWSFSVMTRLHLILAFPYFISQVFERDSSIFNKRNIKRILTLLAPVMAVLFLMGVYNYLRFGDFKDMGYMKMRLNEPYSEYIKHGQFNIIFLPKNLYYMLIAPPKFQREFPFFSPDPWGMGIIFCSPIFLILYRSISRRKIPLFVWISISLILIPILLYYTTGGAQYGYRFIMDFLPFLVILMIEATRGSFKNYEYGLILISVSVNLRGIFWQYIF